MAICQGPHSPTHTSIMNFDSVLWSNRHVNNTYPLRLTGTRQILAILASFGSATLWQVSLSSTHANTLNLTQQWGRDSIHMVGLAAQFGRGRWIWVIIGHFGPVSVCQVLLPVQHTPIFELCLISRVQTTLLQ